MKRKYVIEYDDTQAGIAAFCPSTSEEELHRLLPGVSLYRTPSEEYLALSEPGPVRLMGTTEAQEPPQHRLYVGIKDDKSKKIKIMPAMGSRIVELATRLQDVHYGRGDEAAKDLSDLAKRRSVNAELVSAFGSTRRVRQLGASAEGRVDSAGVTSANAIADTIEAIGEAAEKEGLTTAQVMAKVSEMRNIPPHNPAAKTAQEAYRLSAIVPDEHLDKLNWKPLFKAFTKPGHLEALRAKRDEGQGNAKHVLADPFVDFMLGARRAESLHEDGSKRLKEASQWLALYGVCRSLLAMRRDARVDGGSLATPGLAAKHGFHSPQAFEYFVSKYCLLSSSLTSEASVIQRSNNASHLLRTTMAVCALRAFDNSVTSEMAENLLKSMKDQNIKEVMGYFREVGCKVKSVRLQDGSKSFLATLLTFAGSADQQDAPTLHDALPLIKKPGGPKAK